MYYVTTRLLFGWPTYLLTNDTGHDCHERQPEGRGKGKKNGLTTGVNHYNPSSPLFEQTDAKPILLTDIGILTTLAVLGCVGRPYGWSNLAKWYFLPYIWVNSWLVTITLLQNTDPSLPHYTPETWNYVRGAASTIDRDFGFIGRHLFHGIIETHVFKPVMGVHYRSETAGGPIGYVKCLWRNVKMCRWVEPASEASGASEGVLFYWNRVPLGPTPRRIL